MTATDPGLPDAVNSALLDAMQAGAIDNGQTYGRIAERLTEAVVRAVPDLIRQAKADALDEAIGALRRAWANDGVYAHPADPDTWGTADVWLGWHAAAIRAGRP